MEFSYSSDFEDNVYVFIVVFKIVQMLMDVAMEEVLREHCCGGALRCAAT